MAFVKRVLLGLVLAMGLVAGAAYAQVTTPIPTLAYAIKVVSTPSPLSVTTTSSRVALGTATVSVFVTNQGPASVCVMLGTVGVVAVCPGSPQVPSLNIAAGETKILGMGSSVDLAAITPSGTATLTILTGYLEPALGP
jgi:hypothetical protein